MSNDFTFIIHGNYDETHVPMCAELKQFGKIILSTNKKHINRVSRHIHHYDKLVFESDIDVTNKYNHQNIYLHINSVLNGLRQCDTQYVIKFRSNHCYSNIQYIVNKVRSNINDKYLCSNITVNPYFPYHPCDNIIAGTKELLFSIYKTAYNSILSEDFVYDDNDIRLCAEVLLFISYLKYKNIKINKINGKSYCYVDKARNDMIIYGYINDQYESIMKANLELIDIENLIPYVTNFSHVVTNKNIKSVDDLLSKTIRLSNTSLIETV